MCVHTVSLSTRDNKGANNCIDAVYALWFGPLTFGLGRGLRDYCKTIMGHLSCRVLAHGTTHICHGLGLIAPNMNTCVKNIIMNTV